MSDPLADLRAALGSIEPSVGFEQRTLRHIANTRSSRAGSRRWMLLVPVAAAAVVIAAVASRSAIELRPSGGLVDQAVVRGPHVPAPPVPVVPAEATPQTARRARHAPAAAVRLAFPESAHIDQAIAVRRLMLSATSGKVIGAPDANQLSDDGSIRLPALIEIKPIVIAPLPIGHGGGSER